MRIHVERQKSPQGPQVSATIEEVGFLGRVLYFQKLSLQRTLKLRCTLFIVLLLKQLQIVHSLSLVTGIGKSKAVPTNFIRLTQFPDKTSRENIPSPNMPRASIVRIIPGNEERKGWFTYPNALTLAQAFNHEKNLSVVIFPHSEDEFEYRKESQRDV